MALVSRDETQHVCSCHASLCLAVFLRLRLPLVFIALSMCSRILKACAFGFSFCCLLLALTVDLAFCLRLGFDGIGKYGWLLNCCCLTTFYLNRYNTQGLHPFVSVMRLNKECLTLVGAIAMTLDLA